MLFFLLLLLSLLLEELLPPLYLLLDALARREVRSKDGDVDGGDFLVLLLLLGLGLSVLDLEEADNIIVVADDVCCDV